MVGFSCQNLKALCLSIEKLQNALSNQYGVELIPSYFTNAGLVDQKSSQAWNFIEYNQDVHYWAKVVFGRSRHGWLTDLSTSFNQKNDHWLEENRKGERETRMTAGHKRYSIKAISMFGYNKRVTSNSSCRLLPSICRLFTDRGVHLFSHRLQRYQSHIVAYDKRISEHSNW